ncbi:MAG: hypothetical protein WCW65_02890 [Candidatus Paceibacterota bacterium]
MNRFKELEGFGINFPTLIFSITLFFTILQVIALIKQNRKIVRNKSGDSVSFPFFSFYAFAGIALIFYGLYASSLALTLNGFLGFIMFLISINLLKFKKITTKEKLIGASSLIVVPMMIFLPQKDLLLFISGLIIQFFIFIQIIELWKSPDSGSVHPEQAIVSIFSGAFWLIYSIQMSIWPMVVNNILGVSLWIVLVLVYFKKPKKIKPSLK